MSRGRILFAFALLALPGLVVEGCSTGTDYQGGKRSLPTEVPTSVTTADGAVVPDTGADSSLPDTSTPDTSGGFDAGADVKTDG